MMGKLTVEVLRPSSTFIFRRGSMVVRNISIAITAMATAAAMAEKTHAVEFVRCR